MILHAPVQVKQPLADTPSQVVRELKNKQVHRFRMHLLMDLDGEPETIDYEVRAVTVNPPDSTQSPSLELTFTNYVLHAASRVIHKKLVGAGTTSIAGQGLPGTLMDSFQNTHYWYPLLALYLPEDVTTNQFKAQELLGAQATLAGEGKITGSEFVMTGALSVGSSEVAKYELKWSVNSHGWTKRADGQVTDKTGTIHFTLREQF